MIWLALAMAVAYCAPPGAVTAAAFGQAARSGWRGALAVELGSVIGDAAYGALALSGLATVLRVPWARDVLGAAGAALLLYLAYQALIQARRARPAPRAAGRRSFWSAFGLGAGLALANPMAIPYWLSFGSAELVLRAGVLGAGGLWSFFAAFVAGCLGWSVAVALAMGGVRTKLTPAGVRAVSLACAVALAGFGVALGASLLGA
jgi:chemosensory pili system protein ChpE